MWDIALGIVLAVIILNAIGGTLAFIEIIGWKTAGSIAFTTIGLLAYALFVRDGFAVLAIIALMIIGLAARQRWGEPNWDHLPQNNKGLGKRIV